MIDWLNEGNDALKEEIKKIAKEISWWLKKENVTKEMVNEIESLTNFYRDSVHIMITISGFTSQGDLNDKTWIAISNWAHFLQCYGYRWPSGTIMDLIRPFSSFSRGTNNAYLSGKMLAWALLL